MARSMRFARFLSIAFCGSDGETYVAPRELPAEIVKEISRCIHPVVSCTLPPGAEKHFLRVENKRFRAEIGEFVIVEGVFGSKHSPKCRVSKPMIRSYAFMDKEWIPCSNAIAVDEFFHVAGVSRDSVNVTAWRYLYPSIEYKAQNRGRAYFAPKDIRVATSRIIRLERLCACDGGGTWRIQFCTSGYQSVDGPFFGQDEAELVMLNVGYSPTLLEEIAAQPRVIRKVS